MLIAFQNGGGDAQGHERGKEYDNMNGDFATYIEDEVLPRVEKHCKVKLTKDPGGRAAMGCSSRGSAALIMASTQSCMSSRVTFGLSRSRSPTWMNRRIGFFGSLGLSVSWNPHAPSGNLGSNGHAWFTNVPEVVSTRWYWSVRDHANHRMAEVLKEKGYEYQYLFCQGPATATATRSSSSSRTPSSGCGRVRPEAEHVSTEGSRGVTKSCPPATVVARAGREQGRVN
ncbi:alpha/beta hydrolase-fold protein [Gemmata sp.]|uniref:alpha/beta hydrolase-fold protein n=1 Tax=Gemmata sp. TaxID=1914242 RepID=UPI003F6EE269